MRKVYVIGHIDHDVEMIRIAANIPTDVQVVCVSSVNDIPIEERMNPRPLDAHKLTLAEKLPCPDLNYCDVSNKKIKGHQRPYKFHR